jgi:hypothetical protein
VHKKVLIITYYWPPGGGAGVQRWLKFAKYIGGFGWTPVIYTPSNGEMPVIDESLQADVPDGVEVIRRPIWEPYSVYKKFVGASANEKINTGFLTEKKKPGMAQKLSVWIRGNLFIPDARCFWISPSVKFLKNYLTKNHVDAIVSTGPPHSMHLIAHKLSTDLGIPWLADFRDPWTNIDYYRDLMLSPASDRKHHRLESMVVRDASRVVVIGNTMKKEFEAQFGRKIDVVTNGYDESDVPKVELIRPSKFILAHIGTLVKSRNPAALWSALRSVITDHPHIEPDLEIRLIGKVDISVRESLAEYSLMDHTVFVDYLPHDKVVLEQRNAEILLLLLNDTPNAKGILTGKMFEYMASGRNILCTGPVDGDAAAILGETGSGQCFNFTDEAGIRDFIVKAYSDWKSGSRKTIASGVEAYSRRNLAGKMASILDEIIK